MVTRLTNYTKQRYVLNSTDDPGDIVFRNGDTIFLMDVRQELIYSEENNQWYPVPSGGGGGGSGPQWTLIGESTHALPEYTDTSTLETTDTGINVKDTDYAWLMVVVTCDTAIETSTEWGMSIFLAGRYTAGGTNNLYTPTGAGCFIFQKGYATLSHAAMTNPTTNAGNNLGMCLINLVPTVKITRKANAAICPKFRAGNYTVKVYGLSSL